MKKIILILCAVVGLGQIDALAGNVTSQTGYSVVHSDSTRADAKQKSEFNGGSKVYFESLGDNSPIVGWFEQKTGQSTFKSGWTRLILDWPVRISSIVIHKASVGKNDFRGGSITVEVQNPKGKWTKIYEQEDRDIDTPVSIQNALRSVGPIKGVRISFRSSSPITIGPIDVNG